VQKRPRRGLVRHYAKFMAWRRAGAAYSARHACLDGNKPVHWAVMKITPSEREALLGPAFVGVLIGAVVACCSVAFDSDYGQTVPAWRLALGAMLDFAGGFLLAFVPFGCVPVLVGRRIRRNRSS